MAGWNNASFFRSFLFRRVKNQVFSRYFSRHKRARVAFLRCGAERLECRQLLSNPAFYAGQDYAAGEGASVIIAADLNNDGKPDLVTANYTESNVSVLLNKGDGTFGNHSDYPAGQNPSALAAADLNGDHKLDLIVANADDNTISVLLNQGYGTFAAKVDYASGVHPISVTADDFDGDGRVNIAVANGGDKNLRIFQNLGNGAFAPLADLPFDAAPEAVTATDLNNDGRADLAIAFDSSVGNVQLLLDNGNGTFTTGNGYSTGYEPGPIIVADMDHNGALDLVIGTSYNGLHVYLNSGNASLAPSDAYNVGENGSSNTRYAAGDFNGDGYIDVISTFSSYSYLSTPTVLLNQHDGTLSEPIDTEFTHGYWSPMVAADFNGDGLSDIAAADHDPHLPGVAVSVSLNAGPSLFGARSFYDGDTRPFGVIPGDFNNDGRMDLFVQGSTVGSHVAFQNADGTFSRSEGRTIDGYLLAADDFNHDGYLDVVSSVNGIGIQLNNGNGTFGGSVSLFATSEGYTPGGSVVVGDFNGDGWPDLAANIWGSSGVQVRLNLHNGTFSPASEYAGSGQLTAADFTNDGRIDIAVSTPTGVKILRNTGNGQFTDGPLTPIAAGNMLAGDFDSDKSMDLAIINDDGVFLLRNKYSGGNFTVSAISTTGSKYNNLTEADFNGDGTLDLASTGWIYLNHGAGVFEAPIAYPVGQYAMGIASADLNKDGKPDLTWANLYSNSVSVVLNDFVRTDIAAPSAPDLSDYYDTGRSHFDNITNAASPPFSGTGEAGLTVILYSDGVEVGRSCVDQYGGWSITPGALSEGKHVLRVRQGNAFGTSDFSAALNVTIDTIAPSVSSAAFEYNATPNLVTIGYSEDVSWSLGANDFQLSNLTTAASFTLAHSYYGKRSHVQSIASPILPDGNYLFRVKADGVQDIAGNNLATDYDFSFFAFAGDANRDRKVDPLDLGIVSANWQGNGKIFSQGDLNYDGKVDIKDLAILAAHWQQTLLPPPPSAIVSTALTSPVKRAPARVATLVI